MNDYLQSIILAAYPRGSRIVAVQSYRPDYLPYPARIIVENDLGARITCVLKVGPQFEQVTLEARVLTALAELGLSVPTVLAGPIALSDDEGTEAAIILSELPGTPLPWLGLTDLAAANLTCHLVQHGVDTLHALTGPIREHAVAPLLPSISLLGELQTIIDTGGVWFEHEVFVEAITLLQMILPTITTPLVFSNGDYNPLNFLHSDQTVTGWIDFEHACFEDPYIGFAKFMLWANDDYGWGTGNKAGLVERYLYAHNISRLEWTPRFVLRCLRQLQERGLVQFQHTTQPSLYMLDILAQNVAYLKQHGR
jgi:aminoglycoside phosphotransferase